MFISQTLLIRFNLQQANIIGNSKGIKLLLFMYCFEVPLVIAVKEDVELACRTVFEILIVNLIVLCYYYIRNDSNFVTTFYYIAIRPLSTLMDTQASPWIYPYYFPDSFGTFFACTVCRYTKCQQR